MKTIKLLVVFSVAMACLFPAGRSTAKEETSTKPKVIFFYSHTCSACLKILHEYMPFFEKQFTDKVEIVYKDIADIENYKLLIHMQAEYGQGKKIEVPMIFFGGEVLTGIKEIQERLGLLARHYLLVPHRGSTLAKEKVDLVSRFLAFSPFALISAGLIDGINPCAFTVIVFFISFLGLQGYKKRELVIIGLSFICSVFLTYLLIGLGLFGFLYRLRGFWFIARIVNYGIGLLSIGLGIAALADFFTFKRTGSSEGLLLQLPRPIKNRINKIIGLHYRERANQTSQKQVLQIIFTAFVTGFFVSLLEAVCTGQVYLPTITFVLKTTALKAKAFFYLMLYNLMFIIPLVAVFILALLGVTSTQFSLFLKRNLLTIKILMAILFFSLGAIILLLA
ncbi:MAG: hypothetical protein C4540_01800 [Candidatus Omnitrophota bacterium]|nr:MAG: hypothetical protein C4540_01800 [Candidatus Omnitrophota bacterium]